MKTHKYFSENTEFTAIETKEKISFLVQKKTIPTSIQTQEKLNALISDYLLWFPPLENFKEGYADSFFCMVCQLFSDANSLIANGDFCGEFYQNEKPFELSFKFDVIIGSEKIKKFSIIKIDKLLL